MKQCLIKNLSFVRSNFDLISQTKTKKKKKKETLIKFP